MNDKPIFTDKDKLACIEREIAMRERVYPRWIKDGRMKREDAEREIACMRAIADDMREPPAREGEIMFHDQVDIARALPGLARRIDHALMRITAGKRVAFSLYTWSGNRAQYVSNAPRELTRQGMQEILQRWDEDEPPPNRMV